MNTDHFKKLLIEEKTKLERELAGVGRKNQAVPGDYEPVTREKESEPDILDQAKNIQSYEEDEGILRDLEARYDQVLAALGRIEDGTYGKCSVCGEPIEEDRLDADPAAATCKAHLK